MTTLPANLVLGLAADILAARAQRLRNRAERNPRPVAASVTEGRRQVHDRLMAQARTLRGLRAEGEIAADRAGLLLAWVGGCGDALVQLEALEPRLESIKGYDYVEACRLLLAAREDVR